MSPYLRPMDRHSIRVILAEFWTRQPARGIALSASTLKHSPNFKLFKEQKSEMRDMDRQRVGEFERG